MGVKFEFLNLIDMNYSDNTKMLKDIREFICEKTKRIQDSSFYVISPFIGSYSFLSTLFHLENIKKWNNDLRLITDISNLSKINYKTILFFAENGEVRTLDNLHAKLYIIGKDKIITSANFTRKAFMGNWELAVTSRDTVYDNIFEQMWQYSEKVTINELKEKIELCDKNTANKNPDSEAYEDIWKLQLPPELIKESNYQTFLEAFNEIERLYEPYKRWANQPLKYEIDSFLNYLFHHEDKPSAIYKDASSYREISAEERINEIKYWAKRYHEWFDSGQTADDEYRRIIASERARNVLLKNKKDATIDDFIGVMISCIESFKRLYKWCKWDKQLKKYDITDILKYTDKLFSAKVEQIDKLVKDPPISGLGKSGAQELLGLCKDEFPIRNENTNAGLRFFGFKV